jgi:hypothetical protein
MGLVAFGPHRVGFWVVARGISARGELPASVPVSVFGEPSDDRRALVVAAADDAGQVVWGLVIHDDGASLLMVWDELMFVALGRRALLVDAQGRVQAERLFGRELGTVWRSGEGLLLLGRGWAAKVDGTLATAWEREFGDEALHLVEATPRTLKLAAMGAEDWRELRLDVTSGRDTMENEVGDVH